MNDAGIIDLYWQRAERAIPETENAYGPYTATRWRIISCEMPRTRRRA